ncbi:MAG: hypothetical protein Crog4KO_01470 [Crocinitomicaceae bacterium]
MSEKRAGISRVIKNKQSKLWKHYYTLYMHYAYGTPMPFYFPAAVLEEFPDQSYKTALKEAIASLQQSTLVHETKSVNGLIKN